MKTKQKNNIIRKDVKSSWIDSNSCRKGVISIDMWMWQMCVNQSIRIRIILKLENIAVKFSSFEQKTNIIMYTYIQSKWSSNDDFLCLLSFLHSCETFIEVSSSGFFFQIHFVFPFKWYSYSIFRWIQP